MLCMMANGEAAEDDVAELVAAEQSCLRHHPPHAERRADLLDMTTAARPRANHFLQCDDVRINRTQHLGDARRSRAPIHPA